MQTGGAQTFGKLLMEHLSNDFEFTVLSGFEDFYSINSFNNINVFHLSSLLKKLALILEKIYMLKRRKLILTLGFVPFIIYIRGFSFIIKREWKNYDVIISTDDYYQGEFICSMSGVKRKPFFHILNSAEPLDLKGIPGFGRLSIKFLKYFSKINDVRFMALNNKTKCEFEKLFGRNVKLINIGVDTNKFKPINYSLKKNYLLYVGRLDEKQKNISLLIKAIALLLHNNYTLLIVGSGPDSEYYKRMINEFHLEDKCKLLGRISDENVLKILSESKIFINPSTREGQSNAVLEAMSSGCATICVDNFGARETIKNNYNGIIVSNDIIKLSQILDELLHDEIRIKELSDNARNTVIEKFNIQKQSILYRDAIIDLIGEVNEDSKGL